MVWWHACHTLYWLDYSGSIAPDAAKKDYGIKKQRELSYGIVLRGIESYVPIESYYEVLRTWNGINGIALTNGIALYYYN